MILDATCTCICVYLTVGCRIIAYTITISEHVLLVYPIVVRNSPPSTNLSTLHNSIPYKLSATYMLHAKTSVLEEGPHTIS